MPPASASAPTVGVIGLGYGRAHIPAFQAQGCRVVAVCQRDRAAAKAVADRYGVPRVYERWEDMLAQAGAQIVVIATPPHLHLPIALRAFESGAHVLCEKPLALTAAEARRMAEAARRSGRVAMTAFNWRFVAAMQELHARVRAGALGRVFHVEARWLSGRWADETLAATWRMDRAQAGHGAMGDQGVHLVDLVRSAFGEVVRVTGHAGIAYPGRAAPGVGRPPDAEDYCTVLAQLASGPQVTLTVSRVAHAVNEHTVEAYGAAGALRYRLVRDGPRWWEGELRITESGAGFQCVEPRAAPAPSVGEGDPVEIIGKATIAPLVARLLDGVRGGRTPSPSFDDGVRAQAVLDAVSEALRRRGWVEVEA